MDFFEKDEYGIDDIQGLIDHAEEESLNLDFKAADALQKTDGKKKEIAKDVSAFANSAGGIIVYGLVEQDHVAHSFSFIDGDVITKEWLEQVINTNIQRRIHGLKIIPIRRNDDIRESLYVVKIPESVNGPHMTSEKRFFKRFNFESVPMEEYEVRLMYNQRGKTDIDILECEIVSTGRMGDGRNLRNVDYAINFMIRNVGSSIEEIYKIELKVPVVLYLSSNNQHNLDIYTKRREADSMIFSIPNTSPLFPNEQTPVASLNVKIGRHQQGHLGEPVIVKLYYTNGTKEKQWNLGIILQHNGVPVNELQFI